MKKEYIHPEMGRMSAWVDMPLLQTLPVSGGTTTGQLTKERIEEEEEMDEAMIMMLRDIEVGNTDDLW